jgi:dienelactone hydrolase
MNETGSRAAQFATLIFAALWANAPAAQAQTAVNDFSAGPGNGTYKFASWTPKTTQDLLKGNAQNERTDIVGHLFLPKGSEKVPAVILMHGSGGIYKAMLDYWPKQFNAARIAVLSVDSFGPRGVKSVAEDQSLVPLAADLADAFAALRLMASHPRIDASRVAVMGFSRGGQNAWRTAVERIIAAQKLPDGLRFAAHIPVYAGGCGGQFRLVVKPGVFSMAPMLWIHGDADDYTAIGPCQDYADKIGKAGTPVEFLVLKGARHKFDEDNTRLIQLPKVQRAAADCPLELDIDTFYAYDRTTGERLQGDAYRAVVKKCMTLGGSVQGNTAAREKAAQATLAFLKKVFAR